MGVFGVDASWVVAGADCTWCGAVAGRPCVEPAGVRDWEALDIPHAQRWRDYWNTIGREHQAVYAAPWRRKFREPHPSSA